MGCMNGNCGLPDEVVNFSKKNDLLANMLKKQDEFEQQLGYKLDQMTDQQRAEYVKEQTLMAEHELHEMLQEMPFFKPWKKYEDVKKNDAQWEEVRKEFIDAVHFVLAVALAIGLSPVRLYLMYLDKMQINKQRQEDTDDYQMAMPLPWV